jgi:large subunit ribosomal protein L25
MIANTGLTAKRRSETGKGAARKIRAAGQVPAVIYGKDQEPIALTLDAREASQLFHAISVENTIVNVQVDDDAEELETLVREIQMHPYRPDIVHVDFYCIQRGVAMEIDVPINYTGTPEGVKFGGVLEVILHELRVKCIPSRFPESFEVDVSALDVGDSIHASAIEVEEDIELLTDPVRTLCLVAVPKEEVVEEEEEDLELAEGEVAEGEEGEEGAPAAEGDAPAGDEDSGG